MLANELKTWRENARWSQPDLATQLHVTLDKIKNWESGRTAIPENISSLVLSWDIPAAIAQKPAWSSYLDSRGEPVTEHAVGNLSFGATYYRFPWKDPAGHLWYSLWQMQRVAGELVHRCTDICLDATAWRHHWDMRPIDPAFMARNLATLDSRVAHKRTPATPASRYNSAMEELNIPRVAFTEPETTPIDDGSAELE